MFQFTALVLYSENGVLKIGKIFPQSGNLRKVFFKYDLTCWNRD